MQTTRYLYNCEATEFAEMPYKEALYFKIDKAEQNMRRLNKKAKPVLHNKELYNPLLEQYLATEKAKKFNEQLLIEIRDK